ncbi:MAG: glycosyltransferase [Bacteroidales bacterium]|nr:glycosyltransferase [Bacteroidales bacterium]
MQKQIHIISFANPYPPNYGGVIDVFYKIKALHEAGIGITLHLFEYHQASRGFLEPYCEKVFYYPRPLGILHQFSFLPYIVNTRKSKELLKNLLLDDYPILFDGLHCTYFLAHDELQHRQKVVRAHNVEHVYYTMLASREKEMHRKFYFLLEAKKLKRYEHILTKSNAIASISQTDESHFKLLNENTKWVGAFHPFSNVNCKSGKGDYILYHGNLEVAENLDAVIFILKEIMPGLNIPLYVVGKNPPAELYSMVEKLPNSKIIANPSDEEMEGLIANAQINLLPTFQPTGLKLKLLYSLYAGRHVVVSPEMVQGSGLDSLCHVCHLPSEFKDTIKNLMNQPFDKQSVKERSDILNHQFSNKVNAQLMIELLFPSQK